MSKKPVIGVIRFPGSNCEQDCIDAIERKMEAESRYIWYQETELGQLDALMIPGGFSYGDYLRSGAIARFSPIMASVAQFARDGYPVVGICNGFQVLTESGLLEGALVRNKNMNFICDTVGIEVVNTNTPFTNQFKPGQKITLPVAHADGNFTADDDTLKALEDNGQVVFRYTEEVNGSQNNIAGITNKQGNVVGLMPHPERNLFQSNNDPSTALWNGDGATVFDSLLNHCPKSGGCLKGFSAVTKTQRLFKNIKNAHRRSAHGGYWVCIGSQIFLTFSIIQKGGIKLDL